MTRTLTELQDIDCLRHIAKFLETPMSHAVASPHWPAAIRSLIDRLTAPEPQSFEIGPDETSSIEPKAVFGDATGNSIASIKGQDRSKPTPAEPDVEPLIAKLLDAHKWVLSNVGKMLCFEFPALATTLLDVAMYLDSLRTRTQPAGVDREKLQNTVREAIRRPTVNYKCACFVDGASVEQRVKCNGVCEEAVTRISTAVIAALPQMGKVPTREQIALKILNPDYPLALEAGKRNEGWKECLRKADAILALWEK